MDSREKTLLQEARAWITFHTGRSKIVSIKKLLEMRTNAVQFYGI